MYKKTLIAITTIMTMMLTACGEDGSVADDSMVLQETVAENEQNENYNEETMITEQTSIEESEVETVNSEISESVSDINTDENETESEAVNDKATEQTTVDYEYGYDEDLLMAEDVRYAVEVAVATDADTYFAVADFEDEITVVTLGANVISKDDILDLGSNGVVADTIDGICGFHNTALKSQKAIEEGLKIVIDTDINVKIRNFADEDVE